MIILAINNFCKSFFKDENFEIKPLPAAGSDRKYFRVYHKNVTYILAQNNEILENKSFIAFAKHFKNNNTPVPTIIEHSNDYGIYLQNDLGDNSLYDLILTNGYTNENYDLYKKSLFALANMQINGFRNFDSNNCFSATIFNRSGIHADLLYFKYYFVRPTKIAYNKTGLLEDFDKLSDYLATANTHYFMHRDFQGRNILIEKNQPFFIDFQGGMLGALQYDVASLLWQAKAQLPYEWRDSLASFYYDEANKIDPTLNNKKTFFNHYNGFVLLRLLQVLGAYGFRGIFEGKPHFKDSIAPALRNLKWFFENKKLEIDLPYIRQVITQITEDSFIENFEIVKATNDTKLHIIVNSFSYKRSIPIDKKGNGGGFVFDCRGIYNPGRHEQYKLLTGRDKPVIDFLESNTSMPFFIKEVQQLIDISIQEYIKRDFENLMINFGCTGGQHRSVYAADTIAQYLKTRYNLNVNVNHTEQELKSWINEKY